MAPYLLQQGLLYQSYKISQKIDIIHSLLFQVINLFLGVVS